MLTRGASPDALADASNRPMTSGMKSRQVVLTLAALAGLAICWQAAEVRPLAIFEANALASVWAFVRGLFPPDFSPAFLRTTLSAALQTIAIAITGTVLSIVIALPLGVLSTATLWRRGVLLEGEPLGSTFYFFAGLSRLTRALLGFLRAVPDLVWALLFVVAVGLGPLAGALALSVSYAGVLGRVYADIFEDVDARPLEALRATGATRPQVFLRAIWPQAAPSTAAYTLYSFECCVRSASVLGFVGAGGIGYEINISMRLFEYGQVMTLILALVGLLSLTDVFSRFVRRRLHGRVFAAGILQGSSVRAEERGFETDQTPDRRLKDLLVLVASLAVVALSLRASGLTNGAGLDSETLSRMIRFVGQMIPPDLDTGFIKSLGVPLLQTIGISVIGTIIGIVVGSFLALPSTSTLLLVEPEAAGHRSLATRAARRLLFSVARLLTVVLRSIPELVWVLICILAVGVGPFAGTLAIGLHTGGVLGKLYAETLEEAPRAPLEALRAAGGRPVQILIWGILPQVRATIISYTILRWEMNLRVSTILGLVGGGGLGQAIFNNVQLGFYPRVATLIALVYLLVIVVDWLGDRFRVRNAQAWS